MQHIACGPGEAARWNRAGRCRNLSAAVRVCPRCLSSYSTEIEFCGIDGERLVDQATDPLIGKKLDRYTIVERIGSGAMGCVYRARHAMLDSDCAIKVLYGETASNKSVARRFQREAQAVSKIRHPNIVSVTDFGVTPEGLTFLAMELVEGKTLEQLITPDFPIDHLRAAGIVRQIAAGLAEAHGRGFIHRDLKPGNVMVEQREDGELVKILDFGLVALIDDSGTKLTKSGFTLGTPAYMAPEQTRGSAVGPKADLYALGVILYEMLCGKPPFEGNVTQVLLQKTADPPPPLPPCSGLDEVAHKLLERQPEDRPDSALEVMAVVDRIWMSSGETLAAGRLGTPLPRWASNTLPGQRPPAPPPTPPPTAATIELASGPESAFSEPGQVTPTPHAGGVTVNPEYVGAPMSDAAVAASTSPAMAHLSNAEQIAAPAPSRARRWGPAVFGIAILVAAGGVAISWNVNQHAGGSIPATPTTAAPTLASSPPDTAADPTAQPPAAPARRADAAHAGDEARAKPAAAKSAAETARAARAKPSPISTPLTAGIDMRAAVSRASSRAGAVMQLPSPAGTPMALTSNIPPSVSPRLDARSITPAMASSFSGRTVQKRERSRLRSACGIVNRRGARRTGPTATTWPKTSMPSSFSRQAASAPAAQRAAVSRAEARSAVLRASSVSYFSIPARSAWPGRGMCRGLRSGR